MSVSEANRIRLVKNDSQAPPPQRMKAIVACGFPDAFYQRNFAPRLRKLSVDVLKKIDPKNIATQTKSDGATHLIGIATMWDANRTGAAKKFAAAHDLKFVLLSEKTAGWASQLWPSGAPPDVPEAVNLPAMEQSPEAVQAELLLMFEGENERLSKECGELRTALEKSKTDATKKLSECEAKLRLSQEREATQRRELDGAADEIKKRSSLLESKRRIVEQKDEQIRSLTKEIEAQAVRISTLVASGRTSDPTQATATDRVKKLRQYVAMGLENGALTVEDGLHILLERLDE